MAAPSFPAPWVTAPSGFQYDTEVATVVTPKDALAFLAINEHPAQRKLKQPRIDAYARKMVAGDWTKADIAVAVFQNGREVLVDGQHTLGAIINANMSSPATITYYRVADDVGLARLFVNVDAIGRSSKEHADALYAGGNIGVDPVTLRKFSAAFWYLNAMLNGEASTKAIRPEERLAVAAEYTDAMAFVDSILTAISRRESRGINWFMFKVPVIAAMIATFNANPVEAKTFWESIRDNKLALAPNSPAGLLVAYFLNNERGGDKAANEHRFKTCIQAWNLTRQGVTSRRKLQVMKSASVVAAA